MTVSFIHINFAPKSWVRSIKKLNPFVFLFGCVGLILCVVSIWNGLIILETDAVREISLRTAKERLAKVEEKKKIINPASISQSQANAVNVVVNKLNLPWLDILDSVEAATPRDVALLSLEPDIKKNMLRGLAEAKTTDEMIGYIKLLSEQNFFSVVTLTRHEINNLDVNKPIRFQFEASWVEKVQ